MPRKHIRNSGVRRNKVFSDETLQRCLNDIREGRHSQVSASFAYEIPLHTLRKKIHNTTARKVGGQTVFDVHEEKALCEHLRELADYGLELTNPKLSRAVKEFLDSIGRTVPQFNNNLPGVAWVRGFRKRNPELFSKTCNTSTSSDGRAIEKTFGEDERPQRYVPEERLHPSDDDSDERLKRYTPEERRHASDDERYTVGELCYYSEYDRYPSNDDSE